MLGKRTGAQNQRCGSTTQNVDLLFTHDQQAEAKRNYLNVLNLSHHNTTFL